jgi:putative cell wall-binding protein
MMEARVTATTRLRRGGIAGLAVATTAGVAILATATSALAAPLTVTDQIGTTAATTIYPVAGAQGVGDLQIALPNSFAIGDTVTVQLTGAGASCGTTNGAIGFSGTPTVTTTGPVTAAFGSTAGSTTDRKPTFTVATASSNGACTTAGVKDQLVLTATDSSTGVAGDFYTVALTNQSVTVGTAVTSGIVTEQANGGAAVTVATVSQTKSSITSEVTSNATSSGVAISPITLTEVTAQSILPQNATTTVTLTLVGGQFTAGVTPTVTLPSGYSTTPAATTLSSTYTFDVTAPATVSSPATIKISGLKVDTSGAAEVKLTASTGGPVIGTALGVDVAVDKARVAGADRYATSAAMFVWEGFGISAVVAGGQGFPDGLSANFLAGALHTGTLLTDPNALQDSTKTALLTTNVSKVYVIGGTAAVSDAVVTAIGNLHQGNNPNNSFITVVRIGGANRYETNANVDLYVANNIGLNGTEAGTAYVASGNAFADALSIGPSVYDEVHPLVLVDGTSSTVSPYTESILTNVGVNNVIIIGGTAAVSANQESALNALTGVSVVYRIAGADRTQTAAQVATYETAGLAASGSYGALASLGFNTDWIFVASGAAYPDALSTGAVAGNEAEVLLLVADANTVGAGAPSYLAGMAGTVDQVITAGGSAAVSPTTAANVALALG